MLDILRPIFYVFIIGSNFYIYKFVKSLDAQPGCPATIGWKPTNLRLLSQLGIGLGIVNLFMPCNSVLYKIPLIGSVFSLLMLAIVFMQIISLYLYCKSLLGEYKDKCTLDRYSGFVQKINSTPLKYIAGLTIGLTIGLLYL